MGTNNYVQCPYGGACFPYAAGEQWSNLVFMVQTWLQNQGYDWQITVWAGDDMEQPSEEEPWDCADRTRGFADGFTDANPAAAKLVNYGTAWLPNPCWTVADVYYVSYEKNASEVLPEVYTEAARDSWVDVRREYFMQLKGSLTECEQLYDPITGTYCSTPAGEFTPSEAWSQIWKALRDNGYGQASLEHSSNIQSQP